MQLGQTKSVCQLFSRRSPLQVNCIQPQMWHHTDLCLSVTVKGQLVQERGGPGLGSTPAMSSSRRRSVAGMDFPVAENPPVTEGYGGRWPGLGPGSFRYVEPASVETRVDVLDVDVLGAFVSCRILCKCQRPCLSS